MINKKVKQVRAIVWLRIAIAVQILSAISLLTILILWANESGDPGLPTPSCPNGIDLTQAPEINHKCGIESEELYFPQWAKSLLPISLSSMLISMAITILFTFLESRKGELGNTQRKYFQICLIVFGLALLLSAFIVALPFVIAMWIPGPVPITF